MARKRMLDSEIWRDRKVIKLSNEAFILWIAIISMADDEGIFVYDPDAWFYELARKDMTSPKIESAMQEIIAQGMVVMYGDGYGFIPAWYKHQVLSHATKSKNKRPPRNIVEQHPDYIASWIKTFTVYRKTPEGERETIAPEYPFQERAESIPDDGCNSPENSGKFQKTPGSIEEISLVQVSIDKVSNITPQAATPKPFEVSVIPKPDPLYNIIKSAMEKVNGDFTNYAKEGTAIKRIIKMTKGDQNAIRVMIRTFFTLRQRNDKYWSSMPFTPSRLAASGVWDGVKEEAKKTLAAADTSWIDAMEKEEACV